jgi:hypothetical protein
MKLLCPQRFVVARLARPDSGLRRWNRGMAIAAGAVVLAAPILLGAEPAFSASSAYPSTISIAPTTAIATENNPISFTATVSCTAGASVCMDGHPSNPNGVLGTVTFQHQIQGATKWTNNKPVAGSKCVDVKVDANGTAQCETTLKESAQYEVRAKYNGVKTTGAGTSDYAPAITQTPSQVTVYPPAP